MPTPLTWPLLPSPTPTSAPTSAVASPTIFGLDTVEQVASAAVRVRFTLPPKAVRATDANDALNPANYSPRGPAQNTVQKVVRVAADANAVDLLMAAPLAAGTWVVGVTGVQTPQFAAITGVSLLAFAASFPFTEPLAAGFVNDDAATVLRKNFNPAITGPNIDSLLAAIAAGDQTNWDNARLALDQCFKSTASGSFLEARAGDDGVQRPSGIGMADELFRKLSILVSTRKLTHESLWKALELYYGSDAVRAYSTSLAEPFALADGDSLFLADDTGKQMTATLVAADFSSISNATAVEVAAALNRAADLAGAKLFAVVYASASTGLNYVRIYTGTIGVGGAVRVLGGRAQSVLQFPSVVGTSAVSTAWTVAPSPSTQGSLRFTFTGGTDPAIDLVRAGDYVNVYGPFVTAHRGAYRITKLKVDASTTPRTIWFEVANATSTTGTTTIVETTDVVFFRPTGGVAPTAVIAQSGDSNALDVALPATTQAVSREIGTGAYLHSAAPLVVGSVTRDQRGIVTVTTTGPHGLQVGAQILVDGVYTTPNSGLDPNTWSLFGGSMNEPRQQHTTTLLSDGRVFITGGISSTGAVINTTELFNPATSVWTQGPNMTTARYDHRATLLQDGRVLITGGSNQAGTALSSCQVYDPVANAWSNIPAMIAARTAHATILLGNSSVLAVGGNESVTTYEIYQPWTNSWASAATGGITVGEYARVIALADLRILVTGGRVANAGVTSAYLFNPSTTNWSVGPVMPTGRYLHTCSALSNGKFLVVGGTSDGVNGSTACALYDPVANTWTAGPVLKNARFAHQAVVLATGKVLVFGGQHSGAALSSVELYDPAANSWSASTDVNPVVGALSEARYFAGAVYTPSNNKVHVFGGAGAAGRLGDVERYPREIGGGGLNGLQTVSVYVSPTQFQYSTPDFPYVSTSNAGAVIPLAAPTTDGILGPFIYDPSSGLAITTIDTTTSQAISKGAHTNSLAVANAMAFPDEPGYLVFGFGTSKQQGPVPYLGRLSATSLLIDQGYALTQDLAVGADVTLLAQKGPWVPDDPEDVGSFYLTASSSGRVAAAATIRDMAATGIDVNIETLYPSDKGLGGEGFGATGQKLSDKVAVWGGDDLDTELATARSS